MTITEASNKCNLSQDTLRYYERIGLIPSVRRRRNGIRDYTEEDCGWIMFIKCLRSAGLPIEVLIEYVSLSMEGDATLEARKKLLVEQREQLIARMEEMKETLERLDYKIESYEQWVAKRDKHLKSSKKRAENQHIAIPG